MAQFVHFWRGTLSFDGNLALFCLVYLPRCFLWIVITLFIFFFFFLRWQINIAPSRPDTDAAPAEAETGNCAHNKRTTTHRNAGHTSRTLTTSPHLECVGQLLFMFRRDETAENPADWCVFKNAWNAINFVYFLLYLLRTHFAHTLHRSEQLMMFALLLCRVFIVHIWHVCAL